MADQDPVASYLDDLDKRGFVVFAKPGGSGLEWRRKVGNNQDSLSDADFQWLKANKSAVLGHIIKGADKPLETPPEETTLLTAAVPAGITTAGAAGAEALAAKAGAGPLLKNMASMAGAMGGGAASEYLPKALGGADDPSAIRGMLSGGVQELGVAPFRAASRGPLAAGEKRTVQEAGRLAGERTRETTVAQTAYDAAINEGQKGKATYDKAQEQTRQLMAAKAGVPTIGDMLGYQPLPADPTGMQGQPAAQAYLHGAGAMRAETGQPLGYAYEGLKLGGGEAPAMRNSVEALEQSLTAPVTGKAKSLMEEMKTFNPEPPQGLHVGENGQIIEPVPSQGRSLDDLRDMRQRISKALATAQGGDRFVLRRLEEMADDGLEPHLPAEIADLRRAYRGTMRVVPYDADHAVERAINPAQVAEHMYESPERALGILQHIDSPSDKQAAREAFAQMAMSKVDPTASPEAQRKALDKFLTPYIEKGVVKELHGSTIPTELRDVLDAPKNVGKFQALLAAPEFRKNFDTEFQKWLATPEGAEMRAKVEAGWNTYTQALQDNQVAAKRLAQAPQYRDKALLPDEAKYAGIKDYYDKNPKLNASMAQKAVHYGLWAGMGGGMGMAYGGADPQLIAAGSLAALGTTGVWRLSLQNGMGAGLATVLASDNYRFMARNFGRYLAGLGSQYTREKAAQSPQPVQMPQ